MFRPSLTETVLLVALAASLVFGGWNWWRKNVYHDALQLSATGNAARVAKTERELTTEMRTQERRFKQEASERERLFQEHLAEISRTPPAERTVYRLRDRWLPVSCPAGTASGDGPAEVGGLQLEDELDFVQLAHNADDVVAERNFVVERYNEYRRAVIEHNRKVRQK